MADRIVRCRMADRHGNRCTGEALDPDADVLICQRHAGLVLELVAARQRGSVDTSRLMPEIYDNVREIYEGLERINEKLAGIARPADAPAAAGEKSPRGGG